MDEHAAAQIDAGVVAQVAVGHGVEEHQVAAAQAGHAGDLRAFVVVALGIGRALQGHADLLEAVLGQARAIEGGGAGGAEHVLLAQLVLGHVDHVLQLLRVGHAAVVAAGGGFQAGGHAADAGGAVVGVLLVVRSLAATGQLGCGGGVERADGGAVGHAGGAAARRGLEQLDGRGRGGAVAAVHAGVLAQVAQGQQAVLQAGHVLAGAAAGQVGAQQGRGRGVAGVEHALGGHGGDAGLLHAAGGLHALEGGDGVGGEVAGGHAVQIAQSQQGALQGLDRVAAVLILQLGVAGGAQIGAQHVAGLAIDLHLHPLGIVAVEIEGVAHGQGDAGDGGGFLCVGLCAGADDGAAAHGAAVRRAAAQLAVLGDGAGGAVAVVAVELDVGPAAGNL